MKIRGTMSYIEIDIDGRTVKIQGEKVIGGFVAEKDTIKNWEHPFENERITDQKKQEIIDKVVEETKDSYVVITFE